MASQALKLHDGTLRPPRAGLAFMPCLPWAQNMTALALYSVCTVRDFFDKTAEASINQGKSLWPNLQYLALDELVDTKTELASPAAIETISTKTLSAFRRALPFMPRLEVMEIALTTFRVPQEILFIDLSRDFGEDKSDIPGRHCLTTSTLR